MTDSRDTLSPFGVLDFLSWDHEKFGRHYSSDEVEKSVTLMREAGVGMVRFDFLWEDMEPLAGQFHYTKYDRLVDLLHENGIKIQALLAYNPPSSGKRWNDAPDWVSYCRYAQNVVDRYKDRIRHWEIWQEPDNPHFWNPQDNMQSYVKLLQHVYPLLKTVDPTCRVHLGGMSRSLPMSLKYVYENGGRDYFDVINIHPFANPLNPGSLDALRHLHNFNLRVMSEYGDSGKPIWFTEIGCPGMKNPQESKNWWLGANPDEDTQAQWVRTVYQELLKWKNIEKIFWCFFRDTVDHFQCGSDFDGLIRHNFTRKPSFDAYQQLAKEVERV